MVVVGVVVVVVAPGTVVVVVVLGIVVVVVVVVLVGGEAVAGFATRAIPTRVEMSTAVNGEIRLITECRGRFTTSIYLVPLADSRKGPLERNTAEGRHWGDSAVRETDSRMIGDARNHARRNVTQK